MMIANISDASVNYFSFFTLFLFLVVKFFTGAAMGRGQAIAKSRKIVHDCASATPYGHTFSLCFFPSCHVFLSAELILTILFVALRDS